MGLSIAKIDEAISYFQEAIEEFDEIIEDCSADLKADLLSQKEFFITALEALEKQWPRTVIINSRIPEIGKCPICKTDLCIDDEDLNFCPTCGQALE